MFPSCKTLFLHNSNKNSIASEFQTRDEFMLLYVSSCNLVALCRTKFAFRNTSMCGNDIRANTDPCDNKIKPCMSRSS